MMMIEPIYEVRGNKKICVNAKDVIECMRLCYRNETYQTLANRAQVHIQSILRWVSVGRADENAMRTLVNSFEREDNYDSVLLINASPAQLKRRCQMVGWDKIINSSKQGIIFMKISDAQEQIAEKLAYADDWPQILCEDCFPGIYSVQD